VCHTQVALDFARALEGSLVPRQLQAFRALAARCRAVLTDADEVHLQGAWRALHAAHRQAGAEQQQQQQPEQKAPRASSSDSTPGGDADQAPAAEVTKPAARGRGHGSSSSAASAAEVVDDAIQAAVQLALSQLDGAVARPTRPRGSAAAEGGGAFGSQSLLWVRWGPAAARCHNNEGARSCCKAPLGDT
jgi:hypothetical protein